MTPLATNNDAPLVVHLIFRLDFGGLETLLIECINRMPGHKYRHAIICLTDYTEFSKKISKPDVQLYALHKPPGLGLNVHLSLFNLLRKLKPQILHTYNLPTIEYMLVAKLAGVPVRVHAEHGRDASDPEGLNWKHNFLRRFLVPVIDIVVPVSRDLQKWLKSKIRVPDTKNVLVNNGVDTSRFAPDQHHAFPGDWPFPAGSFVIGTIGRIQEVKDHQCLVEAFIQLREMLPSYKDKLRLVIIGDGPLLSGVKQRISNAGIADLVWLPGARTDIPDLVRAFSVFALTSTAEGTPVVLLEAMASGLPVVATNVGGIPEVVNDGVSGRIVPPSDPHSVASAIAVYAKHPELLSLHGNAGRERIKQSFSVEAMIAGYLAIYDELYDTKVKKMTRVTESCAE